jgi:ferric enterobactin receptor
MSIPARILLTMLAWVGMMLAQAWPGLAQGAGALQEISGTVKDATGGVLPGVLISIPGLNLATDSDNSGRFLLKNVPPGKIVLKASLPGFANKEMEVAVEAGQNLKLDIVLEVQARADTVTVEYTAPKLMTASDSIGVVTLMPNQVAALPSLGEKDIFRSIQLMPGVSASTESSSGLYVRGGTPDQNLVLFDGFTVYKVDHFFGIFSAFNANAVESTTILKGGFDSKYGGRLSSVVDLVGKTSNKKEIEVGGGASLLSYNAYIDGPIGKKMTFLLAGRRSYQSPFSKRIRDSYSNTTTAGPGGGGGPMGEFTTQPLSTFYDLNARAAYNPSAKDTLTLSLYYGRDDFDNSRTMQMPSFGSNQDRQLDGKITDLSNWGNMGSSLNWQRTWASAFSSRITLAYSRYLKNAERSSTMTVTDPDTEEEKTFENGSTESNHLSDITLRLANSLILGRQHYLEFGAEATKNKIDYYFNFNQDMGELHRFNESFLQAFYLQDRYQPFGKLEVTPGIRATRYSVTKQLYLEPRLSLIFHATGRFRLKAAGGQYHQYASDLTREDPFGGDQNIWTLSDGSTVPVSRANHYIGGASYESANYLFDVEAYHKDLKGLTEFGTFRPGNGRPPRPGEEPPDPGTFDFSRQFFTGSGRAQGVEFLAQKKFGADIGWITYTLGRVRQNFPGLSSTPYPASHDSTHELKIVDSYQFKRFTFSGNWVFATGKPITEPTGSEEMTMPDGRIFYRPTFSDKNGARLPDYHRLDLSASWDFYRGEGNLGQAGVSLFNVYNHPNVWRRQYEIADGELIKTDVNYLGLTVSAFVNFNLDVPSETRKAGPAWNKTDSKEADNSKRWIKPGKEYDFFGTIVSINPDRVTVRTAMGTKEFVLGRKAFLGEPNYEAGAYVHVYYREQTEGNVVTMLVRKVKDTKDVPTRNIDVLDPLRPWRY